MTWDPNGGYDGWDLGYDQNGQADQGQQDSGGWQDYSAPQDSGYWQSWQPDNNSYQYQQQQPDQWQDYFSPQRQQLQQDTGDYFGDILSTIGNNFGSIQPPRRQVANVQDLIAGVGDNAGEGKIDAGYLGNVRNAFLDPIKSAAQDAYIQNSQLGDHDLTREWNAFTNAGKGLIEGGLNTFGQLISPIGAGTDLVAQSDNGLLSSVAKTVRTGYENTLDPLFNFTPSVVGDLTKGRIPGVASGIYESIFDRDNYQKQLEQRKQEAVNQAYQQGVMNGATPEQLADIVANANNKYANQANLAEQPGVEAFSELPAVAQLATGLLDPVANIGSELAFSGRLPKGLTKEGGIIGDTRVGDIARNVEGVTSKVAPVSLTQALASNVYDASGLNRAFTNLGKKLESPQSRANALEQELDRTGPRIQDIAEQTGVTPMEAARDIFENPESANYYQKIGIDEGVASAYKDVLEKQRQDLTGTKYDDYQKSLDSQQIAPDQTALGFEVQKQNATPLDNQWENLGQGVLGKRETNPIQPEAEAAMQEFFPQSVKETQTAPTGPKELPAYMKAVKTPKVGAEVADFQEAARQAIGLKTGKLKLEGPVEKPSIRAAAPLEQFGFAGKAINKLGNTTLPFMSRAYLNSASRAIRDPLGNVVKAVIEGYSPLDSKKVNARYQQLFGDYTPFQKGGISEEVAGLKGSKGEGSTKQDSIGKQLFYLAINPVNEAGSLVGRKLFGDKGIIAKKGFKDFNVLAEDAEKYVKTNIYKQEALRNYDAAVKQAVKSGQIPPELAESFRNGNVSPDTLANFVASKMPNGADLAQAISGEYNPVNFSPEVMDFVEKSLGGTGGSVGNIILSNFETLPDRIEQYNQLLKERYTKAGGKKGISRDLQKNLDSATVTMQDITPDHPIFQEMERDIQTALDQAYQAPVLQEKFNPQIMATAKEVTRGILQHAAQSKNIQTFKRALAREIDQHEGTYASTYKDSLYNQIKTRREEAQKGAALKQEEARQMQQIPRQYQDRVRAKYPGINNKEIIQKWAEVQSAKNPLGQSVKPSAVKTNFPVKDINVDPERFQYKLNYGEGGSVGSLKGVDQFNPELAGQIYLWKDPANGKSYVVNGHNRVGLAKKSGAKTVPSVQYLEARTAQEARAKGALINIAEGNGTAIDAAKYFRDSGATPDQLRAQGLKLDAGKTADALALKDLAPNIFDKVTRGEYPLDRAILIGKKIKDPTLQNEFVNLLSKEGKKLTTSQVSELADQIAGTKAKVETQATLFGREEIKKFNLVEKAKIADDIAGKLKSEKREFGTVANAKSDLSRVGSFDAQTSARIAEQAQQALDIFNTQKTRPGTKISEILNSAANGEITKAKAYDLVRDEIGEIIKNPSRVFDNGEGAQASMFGDELPATQPPRQEPTSATEPTTAPEKTQAQLDQEARDSGQLDMFGSDQVPTVKPPEETAPASQPLDPAEGQFYLDYLYGRNLPSNIPAPNVLQNLAKKFGKVSEEQRQRYFDNMLDYDQHIRQVTGNTFKLDLDTMHPARISDGKSLLELTGKEPPAKIGPDLPQLPAEVPTDAAGALAAVRQVLGDNAGKAFKDMTDGERDLAMSEVAKAMGFPDPTNPHVMQEKFDLERDEAEGHLEALKQDMRERYDQWQQNKTAQDQQARLSAAQQKTLADQMLALRNKFQLEASRGAQGTVDKMYFNYGNKNVLDQALGSILPFNFWSRQNFAYAVKYMANHPYQASVLLHFYNQLEQENKKNGGIPDYAKGNILLWQNPDGSKVLWNFASVMPFNPMGDTDGFMTVADAGDDSHANKTPLAMLFGSDKVNSKGQVTGRDKGIISTFLRPNPIIDIATKTGVPNQILRQLGIVNDGLGSPDPSANRSITQTTGLLPGRSTWRDLGAATGLTQWLRQNGIIKSDLDIEAPINELLFGQNSGKPISKLNSQLALMVQNGELSKEQGLEALAAIKEGNWTPAALRALDAIDAGNSQSRLLSLIGLQNVVVNTPRDQNSNALYAGMAAAGQAKQAGDKTATSDFYSKNPGAEILTSSKKSPDEIRQGLADDQTRSAINQLYADRKAGKLDARQFNDEVLKLQTTNPSYFQKYPMKGQDQQGRAFSEDYDAYKQIGGDRYDSMTKQISDLYAKGDKKGAYALSQSKEYQQVKAARDQFLLDHPDFAKQYKDQIEKKYGPQETKPPVSDADKQYNDLRSAYAKIGGDKYDTLNKQIQELYAQGKTKEAAALSKSADYLRVKAAREQFLLDNPEFAARYNAELTSKYGSQAQPKPVQFGSSASTTGKIGYTSNYKGAPAKTGYSAPKKSYSSSYRPAAKSSGSKSYSKPYKPSSSKSSYYKPGSSNSKYKATANSKGKGQIISDDEIKYILSNGPLAGYSAPSTGKNPSHYYKARQYKKGNYIPSQNTTGPARVYIPRAADYQPGHPTRVRSGRGGAPAAPSLRSSKYALSLRRHKL